MKSIIARLIIAILTLATSSNATVPVQWKCQRDPPEGWTSYNPQDIDQIEQAFISGKKHITLTSGHRIEFDRTTIPPSFQQVNPQTGKQRPVQRIGGPLWKPDSSYCWSFKNDHSRWEEFDDETNRQIEIAFWESNPQPGSVILNTGDFRRDRSKYNQYKVVFNRAQFSHKLQHCDNGASKEVIRTGNLKQISSNAIKSKPISFRDGSKCWSWLDDDGWKSYDSSTCNQLETALMLNQDEVKLNKGFFADPARQNLYKVKLEINKKQAPKFTQFRETAPGAPLRWRQVMRTGGAYLRDDCYPFWSWRNNDGVWIPFDDETVIQIEDQWKFRDVAEVELSKGPFFSKAHNRCQYKIVFDRQNGDSKQVNAGTGHKRDVRRIGIKVPFVLSQPQAAQPAVPQDADAAFQQQLDLALQLSLAQQPPQAQPHPKQAVVPNHPGFVQPHPKQPAIPVANPMLNPPPQIQQLDATMREFAEKATKRVERMTQEEEENNRLEIAIVCILLP